MKKLNLIILQLLFVILIAPNAFCNFMVPLESTIETWGKPLTISNDGHRYFFKNKNGDSAVVYTDFSQRVVIDSFCFRSGSYLRLDQLESVLGPKNKEYEWKRVYSICSVKNIQIIPSSMYITFISSHGNYVALAYDNGNGRYTKINVFDIELYSLIAKENYDPFNLYKNDVVNQFLGGQSNEFNKTIELKINSIKTDFKEVKNFEPIIEMDGNIFPSYIIATSRMPELNSYLNSGKYRGEKNGIIGLKVKNDLKNSNVRLEIRGTNYILKSVWQGVLEEVEVYEIFPTIEYNFGTHSRGSLIVQFSL